VQAQMLRSRETMLANMGKQKDHTQAFQLAFLQQEQQQTQTMMALLEKFPRRNKRLSLLF